MTKESKLTERGVRMPDIREIQRGEIIAKYLQDVEQLHSESSRSHAFAMILQKLLGIAEPNFIDTYCTGFEHYLRARHKDRILKGRADNLFGNVIIEFENNIPKMRSEAEAQLRKYVAILWSQEAPEARTPYLCLAGDGVRFVSYTPALTDPQVIEVAPEQVNLHPLQEVDWQKMKPHPDEIFFWLDRYFLRRELYHPTTERMEKDFGANSHALQTATAMLTPLWRQLKEQNPFAVIFAEWERYLRIVYGSKVSSDDLFIRHTYLATLAKLMAWMAITGSDELPPDEKMVELLGGQIFKTQGIENFLEEDFFSWTARPAAAQKVIVVVRGLYSLLQNYIIRELAKEEGEDVWKSLYQELVDPETRHDLGEFYTPDWLAHRMIKKMLDGNPKAAMLDPACGSGTFLYLAIREKRERLKDSSETLLHILDSVVGADIHPLAVIIAKTNFILALGDLLKKSRKTITIPVYLADTLWLPERYMKGPEYIIHLDDQTAYVPEELLSNIAVYDHAMELAKEFARQNKGKPISLEIFLNFLKAQKFAAYPSIARKLYGIAEILKVFIDKERDTIWAFVLKNRFKPLFFKNRFDFVMGNPPWIAFRHLEPAYQDFVKRQVAREYRILSGRGHLITHLEVATLFLVRAADLYLKAGGVMGFVMPRSVCTGEQHDGLRRNEFRFPQDAMNRLAWTGLWDCDRVKPLFNVPTCVLWAKKTKSLDVIQSFPGEVLAGTLPRKNASLTEAEANVTVEAAQFSLSQRGRHSYWATGEATKTQKTSSYKKKFFQGATMVPRSFWFVRVKPSPLGFNPECPPLETDPRAIKQAKKPYQDVRFEGQVEAPFLFATLLSTDLLPFGHLDYRLVVLPILPIDNYYNIITEEHAQKAGYSNLAKWLKNVEVAWEKRRSSKSENISSLE
ncbi:MAG: N-6 DNA methylase [Desulfobaccales bacterium]